jgi:ubiquinone/menaquinone biosynthesis C-methylase UbiE
MGTVSRDVIFISEGGNVSPTRWVAMNVFAKTSLGISSPVFELLSGNGISPSDEDRYICWEIEYFSNEEGLLEDPTRFRRNPREWKELNLSRDEVLEKLRLHCILVEDEDAYRARFQPKTHLLDFEHFGNFHQQHGQHMMLKRRLDPAQWWMNQKFSEDRSSVRNDNLYGAVQWSFLEQYFRKTIAPGMKVVDLGCGTGIYSNLIASHGAEVVGLDPSDEYLAIAQANPAEGVTFIKALASDVGGLDQLPDASADLLFMSDALLFYYVPFFPGQKADIQLLLREIRRVLKPGGRFVSLEPHCNFYLSPWLGDVDRPFTVVTEYLHRNFNVVPPLSWLFGEFARARFSVTDFVEITPAKYFQTVNARAYHFANEFPLWQLMELKPLSN